MRVPPDVICCGPILQHAAPLEETDPELYSWLSQRPTVLIVLGSHTRLDDRSAQRVLRSCLRLLDARPDVQVLWKLQKQSSYELEGVDADSVGDRLRIVEWLKPDPVAILKTGKVVCFVNHGGSNSYHEGLA